MVYHDPFFSVKFIGWSTFTVKDGENSQEENVGYVCTLRSKPQLLNVIIEFFCANDGFPVMVRVHLIQKRLTNYIASS